jgi:hypothetical protein
MLKLFFIASIIVLSYGIPVQDSSEYEEFMTGFMTGISNNNGSPLCQVDFSKQNPQALINQFNTILEDLDKLMQGQIAAIFAMKKDIKTMVKLLMPTSTNCDFPGFLDKVEEDFTISGSIDVMENIHSNLSTILADIKQTSDCPTSYFNCGKSMGEVIRLIVGAGL